MFEVLTQDLQSKARCGRLTTAHGAVHTPAFIPVGTQGTVKAVTPRELRELKAQIVLGNTYHLFVRPGLDVIKHFGGLHKFMNWDGPILTDSGGYQIFSLARLRKITEDGVHFQNHIDGCKEASSVILSEVEGSRGITSKVSLQDSSTSPRSARNDSVDSQLLFGIVQGATFDDLRKQSAQAIVDLDFDGYAIGGVSVGEPEEEMIGAVESSEPFLPKDKPRYAMGLGTPPQLLEMVARGMDMFDCVLPTRLARNGTAFTTTGTLNLKNAEFALDKNPIEENCGCYACSEFSRGYIRHLIKAEEILGLRLITLHNLHFYLDLMRQARCEIENGTFDQVSIL